MNSLKILLLLGLFVLLPQARAQRAGSDLINKIQYYNTPGKVTIFQDPLITQLIDKHLSDEGREKSMLGYRIRIYYNSGGNARQQGQMAMANFDTRFGKEYETYFIYEAPFYSVFVGNFRSQTDAMRLWKKVVIQYPEASVVRTKIEYPKLN